MEVTKAKAVEILGISPKEIVRRIESGELKARKKTASKFSDWIVILPDRKREKEKLSKIVAKKIEEKKPKPKKEKVVEPEPEPEPQLKDEEVVEPEPEKPPKESKREERRDAERKAKLEREQREVREREEEQKRKNKWWY